MRWPDHISVYHKLRSSPDSSAESIMLDVLIMSEKYQRPSARCVEDLVIYDYRRASKAALPDFALEQFRKTFIAQEQAGHANSFKAQRLLDRVRDLEKQSWDRPDAREDTGNE